MALSSSRRARQKRLDVLRRVLSHLLEEAALGSSFTWPEVASNNLVRGQLRIVEGSLLSGYIPEYARRFLQNLLHQGHLRPNGGCNYLVNPDSCSFLGGLALKASEGILWDLSTTVLVEEPPEKDDPLPQSWEDQDPSPFEDRVVADLPSRSPPRWRRSRASTLEAIRTVLGDKTMHASEVADGLDRLGVLPRSMAPTTYIRFLLSSNKELFERDPSKPRGFYRVIAQ